MSADDYLLDILARERVDNSLTSPVWAAKQTLMPVLSQWGGSCLQQVHPSGSFAKGTANRSGTDIDLFFSLSPPHRIVSSRFTKRCSSPSRGQGTRPGHRTFPSVCELMAWTSTWFLASSRTSSSSTTACTAERPIAGRRRTSKPISPTSWQAVVSWKRGSRSSGAISSDWTSRRSTWSSP